ncbi:Carboxylesterase type B [Penicillium coprophilum]|uniref:Carboxylesterase type B n=1 Tax=Penicillium coprophilum TaxID=36646 RepID=UPI002396E673|nr:Carboxylesterase type B [Penicillium coprophilum]KAJ5169317.1 Carboxylesterase type B [Penicillium coprophilum]
MAAPNCGPSQTKRHQSLKTACSSIYEVVAKHQGRKEKLKHGAPMVVCFQEGAFVSGSKSDQDPSRSITASKEMGFSS